MRSFLLIFIFFSFHAFGQERYLPLPDGSYLLLKANETENAGWQRARQTYPEAFGLKRIPDEKQFDLDYFNECSLKASRETKSDAALAVALQACRYKAIPQKCRSLSIERDKFGNETGEARIRCVEECAKAGHLSRSVGECRKG